MREVRRTWSIWHFFAADWGGGCRRPYRRWTRRCCCAGAGSCWCLSGLTPRPVLCVQRRLTAVNGAAIEPQDIPLPLRWGRLPPEALLLAAGAWLLAEGRLPD